jgi:hypothetical protein
MSSRPSDDRGAKRQDRKAVRAEDDEEYQVLEFAPLFTPPSQTLTRSGVVATRRHEIEVSESATNITEIAADRRLNLEKIDALIAETQRLSDQMGVYIDRVRGSTRRRSPSERDVNDIEDD